MSFYSKDYRQTSSNTMGAVHERDEGSLRQFVKQTYQMFAASLLASAAGAYVGIGIIETVLSFFWGLVILEFALIFGLRFAARKNPSLALVMLFAFTFISGLTLSLTIAMYISRGAGDVVTSALVLTTLIFAGLSIFAITTKRDFTTMGKVLFIVLLAVIGASILNMFLQISILQLAISGVSAILFSFFILYDTQNIVRGNYDSPITAAAGLYLDFINLFISLLNILGIFSADD